MSSHSENLESFLVGYMYVFWFRDVARTFQGCGGWGGGSPCLKVRVLARCTHHLLQVVFFKKAYKRGGGGSYTPQDPPSYALVVSSFFVPLIILYSPWLLEYIVWPVKQNHCMGLIAKCAVTFGKLPIKYLQKINFVTISVVTFS